MTTEEHLNAALDATAKLADLAGRIEIATRINALVKDLLDAEKYSEAQGALKALELITSA